MKIMNVDYSKIEDAHYRFSYEKILMQNQSGYNMYYLFTFAGQFIRDLTNVIVGIFILFPVLFNPQISNFLRTTGGLAIIMSAAIVFYCNKRETTINLQMYENLAPYNAQYNFYSDYYENYNTGKDIRIYSLDELLKQKQYAANQLANLTLVQARKQIVRYKTLAQGVKNLLLLGANILMVSICLHGRIQIGDIAKYVSTTSILSASFIGVISSIQMLFDNNKYLKDYFAFLDTCEATNLKSISSVHQLNKPYKFVLDNISFSYPGSNAYAIRDVSIELPLEGKVAIVGENGCGKTTLIKLLCGLYEPQAGTIYLNGTDLSKYDRDQYMRTLSVVHQDFSLFAFSIAENISCSEEFDTARIISALTDAGINADNYDISEWLGTNLYKEFDDRGIEISGGEAQKIAIARALYKNSNFFLLDEPTASLDPIAENDLYEYLNKTLRNKLAIFVSHRLSSCKFCDLIIVMHKGKIVQIGTHDELLSDVKGQYAKLWNAQASFYLK